MEKGEEVEKTTRKSVSVKISKETYQMLCRSKWLLSFLFDRKFTFDDVIRMMVAYVPKVAVIVKRLEEAGEELQSPSNE